MKNCSSKNTTKNSSKNAAGNVENKYSNSYSNEMDSQNHDGSSSDCMKNSHSMNSCCNGVKKDTKNCAKDCR